MQTKPTTNKTIQQGLSPGDIYFILFRHKWKILICSLLGVVTAVALYFLKPTPYQSEAKLFVRYVLDSQTLNPNGSPAQMDARVKTPDARGENILNSEMEILMNLDLTREVAKIVGPGKILGKKKDEPAEDGDEARAALQIYKNLQVGAPKMSNVIRIAYENRDPDVVQAVLTELVNGYFKKHVEIHQANGVMDDYLTQKTDQLRSQLFQTEEKLRDTRNKAGVTDLTQAKQNYNQQIALLRKELLDAEADRAAREAAVREITKPRDASESLPPRKSINPPTRVMGVPDNTVGEYGSLQEQIELLRGRKQNLLTQFTPENSRVKDVEGQIETAEKTKREMEEKYPQLAAQWASQEVDLLSEKVKLASAESRIETIKKQLEEMTAEATKLDSMEPDLLQLERQKQLEEANFRYFSSNLEQARINGALSAGQVSNISLIQAPSMPTTNPMTAIKMIVMSLGGGVGLGLGWAFLIEMILDRSVKRPIEIESKLGMHFLLSIPDVGQKGQKRLAAVAMKKSKKKPQEGVKKIRIPDSITMSKTGSGVFVQAPKEDPATLDPNGVGLVNTQWKSNPELQPFYEALRDRLVVYFDVRNVVHKPKLVAVTAASKHAGATQTAVGLATTLSETGDGKVLLVDMHQDQEAVQQFFKGRPIVELDDALTTKDKALVHENFYVVSGGRGSIGDKLPQIYPRRFANLVPQLKASEEYDYIIFDMPEITQTSVTPRLAGMMDILLLVLEAEKTDIEIVRQSNNLLKESRANVSVILNKTHNYIPRWLHQDFLSER